MVIKQVESYLQSIRNVFPQEIGTHVLHDSGDDFFIIEVNQTWMFRFPRNELSRKAMEIENNFLAEFEAVSPLPVPARRFVSNDFVGYRKIQGEPLSLETFAGLSNPARNRIAQQIGQFLSKIHNYPVHEATRLGVTEGWDGWYIKIINNFQEMIGPMLSPSVRKNALLCIDQMLTEPFESQVIHGDFALEDHVFYDEARQELSGVIDFADVTRNDPAHDFQNIVEYGGETFFEAVMGHYQGRNDPTLLKRTKLRSEARPLFEVSSSMLFGFNERFKERMGYIEAKYR